MSIKQRDDESLRSYVTQFNKEALLINKANDKVLVIAFTNGLQSREFLFFHLQEWLEDNGWHVVQGH